MKRLATFMIVILLLFSTSFAAPKSFNITVKATLISNDKVGDTWFFKHTINEERFFYDELKDIDTTEDTISLKKGDVLKIATEIEEEDPSSNDYSIHEEEVEITSKYLKEGFTVTFQMEIMEDGGRYKGRKAIWEITYEFTP